MTRPMKLGREGKGRGEKKTLKNWEKEKLMISLNTVEA